MGPFVTLGDVPVRDPGVQRPMVRPSRLISGGQDSSPRSSASARVLDGEDRTLDPVDASYGFLRVPGQAYLSVEVTGVEKTTQSGVAAVADLLVGGREQPPYPIQRVSFPAPVS